MSESKENLSRLNKAVTAVRGGKAKIAKQLGFSHNYVRCVLKGEAVNPQIIFAAVELVSKHEKDLYEMEKALARY